jgi:hypothetical protein
MLPLLLKLLDSKFRYILCCNKKHFYIILEDLLYKLGDISMYSFASFDTRWNHALIVLWQAHETVTFLDHVITGSYVHPSILVTPKDDSNNTVEF